MLQITLSLMYRLQTHQTESELSTLPCLILLKDLLYNHNANDMLVVPDTESDFVLSLTGSYAVHKITLPTT
jgi:hypothetical protein